MKTNKMKKQSGFTLIELMIVVAIVAILAAIAMPTYQNYTKKAKMTELVAATGTAKTAVEVCVQTKGVTPCVPGQQGIPNLAPSAAVSSGVDVTASGGGTGSTQYVITAAVHDDTSMPPIPAGVKYLLTGNVGSGGAVSWSAKCTDAANKEITDYCPN